ncbi:MAG: menaquinone biosynthesis protein [Bacteroidales bacterium]|nr:menaquinone biosynthesis protein [Bacteroidales bacterium]
MKTRVSIINYSNTIPFTYGLLQSKKLQKLAEFSYGYPAQVADMLTKDLVDVSIISVAAIPFIPNAQLITDYCISASQRVDSVLLCSNKPLEAIDTILLDYQSRTSNILVQILAQEAWHIHPTFINSTEGYELQNTDAAKVIIGDRALLYAHSFKYVYDLASEWYNVFHCPFVFAAWVANKQLPLEFIEAFNEACEYGVTHIDEAIANTKKTFQFDINHYLHNCVEFDLTPEKCSVIDTFILKGKEMSLL